MNRQQFKDPMTRYILRYMDDAVGIRFASPDDAQHIWQFICDLAEYEHGRDQVQ